MSTRLLRATILLGTTAVALACGGLPGTTSDPIAGTEEEAVAERLPEPHDLFVEVNGEEPPLTSAPRCPSGTSQIKYPRGANVEVYCAWHNGTKQGPWTRWRGRRLIETRTYAEGVQHGIATRWEEDRKVEESTWAAGVQQGEYAAWDAEGTLLLRGAYVDGERQGRFLELGSNAAFGGACYAAGAEMWRTDDPEAFVSDACDAPPDEVASL